jgi:hypothetical protein
MDSDADLEREVHGIREGIPCVPPLVYLWDPGEVDPPAVSQPRKNFRNLRNPDIVVTFSSRRASPHYLGIISCYKSVLHGT